MIVLSAVDFYFWSGISFAEISLFIDYITVLLTLPLFKYLLFMEEISEANRLWMWHRRVDNFLEDTVGVRKWSELKIQEPDLFNQKLFETSDSWTIFCF